MVSPIAAGIALAGLTVAAVLALVSQCRHPAGWPGRFFLWIMNQRHASVTRWGLGHVPIQEQFTILDVGCGGGRTVDTLAAMASRGKVCGIDYSATSMAAARRLNRLEVQAGRVEIRQASVSHLPYPDGTFDLVSAVETHYYWPDPVADMREILRVLKPGGHFVLIAEAYRGERFGTIVAVPMKLVKARYLTVGQHRELLAAAGYAEVTVHEERRKGWLCAVARTPGRLAG